MSNKEGESHTAKRLRVGERTMLACNGCKQRKLKVVHPFRYHLRSLVVTNTYARVVRRADPQVQELRKG